MSDISINHAIFHRVVDRFLTAEILLLQHQSVNTHDVDTDLKIQDTMGRLDNLRNAFRTARSGEDYAAAMQRLDAWAKMHQPKE